MYHVEHASRGRGGRGGGEQVGGSRVKLSQLHQSHYGIWQPSTRGLIFPPWCRNATPSTRNTPQDTLRGTSICFVRFFFLCVCLFLIVWFFVYLFSRSIIHSFECLFFVPFHSFVPSVHFWFHYLIRSFHPFIIYFIHSFVPFVSFRSLVHWFVRSYVYFSFRLSIL